jgi:hypothetical protein
VEAIGESGRRRRGERRGRRGGRRSMRVPLRSFVAGADWLAGELAGRRRSSRGGGDESETERQCGPLGKAENVFVGGYLPELATGPLLLHFDLQPKLECSSLLAAVLAAVGGGLPARGASEVGAKDERWGFGSLPSK